VTPAVASVPNPPTNYDFMAIYVLNSDAADYRNEQRLKALELKLDRLLAATERKI